MKNTKEEPADPGSPEKQLLEWR